MKYRDVPVRMTLAGGAHHHSLTDGNSLRNRFLNQTLDPGNTRILSLANPVSNQKHKVLCLATGQGITLARG